MTKAKKWYILREMPLLDNEAWYALVAFLDQEVKDHNSSEFTFGEEDEEWPSPTWE